ncbi:PC-esterase domain-containing protein 1B-like [Mizuhopecten yessoensis]|uniref:PC-esterase domain-containing protein 1B n=1 Tax=Mizuhopecten yessoensis TaxID=6573 RepID=A0A210QLA9_MIZYE|nr:PC-esterase domain-containing protein 1B-like [Mizuhopecten yessoensis]OWF49533.1 PC-esterase domain-containing protein 1B [Mizuhopecten yessoensis]
MSDIFLSKDAYGILKNKFVVVIGSSVQRSIYKDLVMLLQKNSYLKDRQLRAKGEMNFAADVLLHGGKKGEMNNGIHYREVRQYKTDYHLVRFYFVTRCFNNYVNSILTELKEEPRPDIVIINSCLWDITRYGDSYVSDYKVNLEKLCVCMKNCLTENCLALWNTTLPVSRKAKGGVIVPEVEHMMNSLQLEVLEANFVARQIVASHGFDVVDLHHFLRYHLHRRAEDGIHWDMTAHRRITNLLLSHITEAFGEKLPNQTEVKGVVKPCTANLNQVKKNFTQRNRTENGNSVSLGLQLQNTNVVPNFLRKPPQNMCLSVHPLAQSQNVRQQVNFGQIQVGNMPSIEERYGGPIRKMGYGYFQVDNHVANYGTRTNSQQHCTDMGRGLALFTDEMNPVDFAEDYQENCLNFQENQLPDNNQMVDDVDFSSNNFNACDNFGQNIEPYNWQPYGRQNYHPPGHQTMPPRHMHRIVPYNQRRRGYPPGMAGPRGVCMQNIRFFR